MPLHTVKRRCEFCGREFHASIVGKRPAAKFCGRKCYGDSRRYFAKTTAQKPLRVSANWIMYAHEPPAESGIRSSAELVDLITDRDYVLIPADRKDLAEELISCAELYSSCYGGDRDDRMRAMQASRIIARARAWIAAVNQPNS